jgi:hypothetical protein
MALEQCKNQSSSRLMLTIQMPFKTCHIPPHKGQTYADTIKQGVTISRHQQSPKVPKKGLCIYVSSVCSVAEADSIGSDIACGSPAAGDAAATCSPSGTDATEGAPAMFCGC